MKEDENKEKGSGRKEKKRTREKEKKGFHSFNFPVRKESLIFAMQMSFSRSLFADKGKSIKS